MSQGNSYWRNIVLRMVVSLIRGVNIKKDFKRGQLPSVLLGDDSYLPKTGMRMDEIGKIFSHVPQNRILGYKELMMCCCDGRSQFMLDCSLHGEWVRKRTGNSGLQLSRGSVGYRRKGTRSRPQQNAWKNTS